MKHQAQNTIKALVMIAALLASVEVFADEDCDKYNAFINRDNLMDLTQAIDAAQNELYAMKDEKGTNAKFDLRRKVDRHQLKKNDHMYALNGIGKVTLPSNNGIKNKENSSWGTGFMISPCHMITNYHVACEEKEIVDGKPVCKKNQNIKNKTVNFSYGENADGTDFKDRLNGTVMEFDPEFDYAIVKINAPRNESLPFLMPNFKNVSGIHQVISGGGGYPAQSREENNHKMYAMKATLSEQDTDLEGNITFTPGNSGSPTYYLQGNKLVASGMAAGDGFDSQGKPKINGKPKIVSMPTIGKSLYGKNPGLFKQVVESVRSGQCQ